MSYIPQPSPFRLIVTKTGLDGTTVGDQTIFTVPAGKNLYFGYAVARLVSLNNFVSAVGATAQINNFNFGTAVTPSVSLLNGLASIGAGDWTPFLPLQNVSQLPLHGLGIISIDFQVPVVVGAGGDATFEVDLFGYIR